MGVHRHRQQPGEGAEDGQTQGVVGAQAAHRPHRLHQDGDQHRVEQDGPEDAQLGPELERVHVGVEAAGHIPGLAEARVVKEEGAQPEAGPGPLQRHRQGGAPDAQPVPVARFGADGAEGLHPLHQDRPRPPVHHQEHCQPGAPEDPHPPDVHPRQPACEDHQHGQGRGQPDKGAPALGADHPGEQEEGQQEEAGPLPPALRQEEPGGRREQGQAQQAGEVVGVQQGVVGPVAVDLGQGEILHQGPDGQHRRGGEEAGQRPVRPGLGRRGHHQGEEGQRQGAQPPVVEAAGEDHGGPAQAHRQESPPHHQPGGGG